MPDLHLRARIARMALVHADSQGERVRYADLAVGDRFCPLVAAAVLLLALLSTGCTSNYISVKNATSTNLVLVDKESGTTLTVIRKTKSIKLPANAAYGNHRCFTSDPLEVRREDNGLVIDEHAFLCATTRLMYDDASRVRSSTTTIR